MNTGSQSDLPRNEPKQVSSERKQKLVEFALRWNYLEGAKRILESDQNDIHNQVRFSSIKLIESGLLENHPKL